MSVFGEVIATTKKIVPAQLLKKGTLNLRLVLLAVAGVVLIVAGSLWDSPSTKPRNEVQTETVRQMPVSRSYEEALEAKLANMLSQVKGAGAVAVNITLENGSVQEYAKNVVKETRTIQEKDTSGGTRITTESKESEQVLLSKEGGADRPVMVREVKPAIKGVLVIAEGAADSTVKANLTKAVEAGLGLPSYKITVLPQRK